MPYIAQDHRTEALNEAIKELVNLINGSGCTDDAGNFHPGVFNYAISMIINDLLQRNKISYSNINKIIGVLECVKLELYRRVASPYEDKMIEKNGDVYNENS